jgi:hypothetical protein
MTIPSIRAAALNTGNHFHLLDHIAPLAHLLQIPLITTHEKNFLLAQSYYPFINVEIDVDLEFHLASLAERFDTLLECKYWTPQLKTVFRELYNKEMRLIFCPHGQSDKGMKGASPMLRYGEQEAVLVYGKLLIQMLQELNIWSSIPNHAVIGNYRLLYYLEHKNFYDQLVEKEIFSHLKKQPTLLYAPTWEGNSFFSETPQLISSLPSHWNLIVKTHPHLEEKDPARFYTLLQWAEKKTNVLVLTEFPPVYPLLAKVDAYLGDFSSVGYDFLYFKKPMFFFSDPLWPPARLQSCGHILNQKTSPFPFIEQNMNCDFSNKQKELYEMAFGAVLPEDTIKRSIFKLFAAK